MSRRVVRENLFKLIYERSVTGEKNALTFNLVFNATTDTQKEYFQSAYVGIDEKFDFLKRLISGYSAEFKSERIYKVDLAIMVLAAYEVWFCEDVPDAAAINEAVEIAKLYSTEKSAAFINGILASIMKNKQAIIEDERAERENKTDVSIDENANESVSESASESDNDGASENANEGDSENELDDEDEE